LQHASPYTHHNQAALAAFDVCSITCTKVSASTLPNIVSGPAGATSLKGDSYNRPCPPDHLADINDIGYLDLHARFNI